MSGTIAKFIAAGRELASSAVNVGYDQGQRRTAYDPAARAWIPNKEIDCSFAFAAAAHKAGYSIDLSDPIWTGNLEDRAMAAGFSSIDVTGWGSLRLYAAMRDGDGLLGPGHVIQRLSAHEWLSAEGDENGQASGGQAGDQTGYEVRIREPYMRSKGWTRILRPPAEAAPLSSVTTGPQWLTITGVLDAATVARWQSILGLPSTGHLDATLITAVQKVLKARDRHGYDWRDLAIDGVGIGSNERGRYPATGKTHTIYAMQADLGIEPDGFLSYPVSGSVKALQARLNTGRY